MACQRVHDFVRGTTIALPHVNLEKSTDREIWDILRPNRKASDLVAQHVRALGTHGFQTEAEGSSDVPAKVN